MLEKPKLRYLTTEEAYLQCPELVKGQEWRGVTFKYRFWCSKHQQEYTQNWSNHNHIPPHQGCPACHGKKRRMSLEEVKRLAPRFMDGQKFQGNKKCYWFWCRVLDKEGRAHGPYQQGFETHLKRPSSGCIKCGYRGTGNRSAKLTGETAKLRCPELADGQEWLGVKGKYKFLCDKHGVYEQLWCSHVSILQCRGCPRCKAEEKRSRRLTFAEAKLRCPALMDGQEFTGVDKEYWFVCEALDDKGVKHGPYLQGFETHSIRQRGCLKCGCQRKLTADEAYRRCPDMAAGQEWLGTREKYWFDCPTHGRYQQFFGAHQRGASCRRCTPEAMQRAVRKAAEAKVKAAADAVKAVIKEAARVVREAKRAERNAAQRAATAARRAAREAAGVLPKKPTGRKKRGTRCLSKNGEQCSSRIEANVLNWFWERRIPYEHDGMYGLGTKHRYDVRPLQRTSEGKRILVEVAQAGPDGFGEESKDYWQNMEKKVKMAEEVGDIVVVLNFWGMDWNQRAWRRYCDANLLPILIKHGIEQNTTAWWEKTEPQGEPSVSPEPVVESVVSVEPGVKPLYEVVIEPTAESAERYESYYKFVDRRQCRTVKVV